MVILILGSVLLGAILGRFFKVLVLVLACAFVLAVVLVRSADGEHGLLRPLLEFAVLITSLQLAMSLAWCHIRFRAYRNAGEPRPRRQPRGRLGAYLYSTLIPPAALPRAQPPQDPAQRANLPDPI